MIPSDKIQARARYIYLTDTANGTVHCNRFPSWSELSEQTKQQYVDRAKRELADE